MDHNMNSRESNQTRENAEQEVKSADRESNVYRLTRGEVPYHNNIRQRDQFEDLRRGEASSENLRGVRSVMLPFGARSFGVGAPPVADSLAAYAGQHIPYMFGHPLQDNFASRLLYNYGGSDSDREILLARLAASQNSQGSLQFPDPLAILRASVGHSQQADLAAIAQRQTQLQLAAGLTSGLPNVNLGYGSDGPLLQSHYARMDARMEALRQRAGLLNATGPFSIEEQVRFPASQRFASSSHTTTTGQQLAPSQAGLSTNSSLSGNIDKDDEYIPSHDLPSEPQLPPIEEGKTPHFSLRTFVPLAIDEDPNWLSERQCFIRAELLEVVRASHQEVLVRSSSKSVQYQQVGIRCRFCAHLNPNNRSIRSAAYPSSVRQMYQSFTMMVRDHLAGCSAMPSNLKQKFLSYQEHKIPSSSLSREYWAYAAERMGMINTDNGITITEESQAAARDMPAFGTSKEQMQQMQSAEVERLVEPSDQDKISPHLFMLMNLLQKCYLLESERVGKRKAAPVGLSGFGCQFCCQKGRLGFCRIFPLNKRSLPTKMNDIHNHVLRCPLVPRLQKTLLRQLKKDVDKNSRPERDREFVDGIWSKLGRKGIQI